MDVLDAVPIDDGQAVDIQDVGSNAIPGRHGDDNQVAQPRTASAGAVHCEHLYGGCACRAL